MDLKDTIRTIPDFPKPGILFRDITPVLQHAEALSAALDLHLHAIGDLLGHIDVVAGVESRGFLFGMALAQRMGAGFVLVRKPGKLPAETIEVAYALEYGTDRLQIHADAITPGQRVVVVDRCDRINHLDARGVATQADGDGLEARVAAQLGAHLVDVRHVAAPVLEADVAQLGAVLEDDLGGRVVEEAVVERLAGVLVDERGLGVDVDDDKGAAGTDAALEAADVALLSNDLGMLPKAHALARDANAVIKQNLGFALGIMALMVVFTVLGRLPLPLGVLGHEGGTILVVLNGLRLLGWRGRQPRGEARRALEPVAAG